ncbi:unannotated protein [freshwater metagenome]|uniref:Unannotated protein n=1 Tax=freshwater metagenome TaxID=449393 RepID=A0A6J6TR32_9ZZZZ
MTIPYGRQEITAAVMTTNLTGCLIADDKFISSVLFFILSLIVLLELIRNATLNQKILRCELQ